MQTIQKQACIVPMAALVLLSWLGAYIHTLLELGLPVWSPENSGPLLVGVLLFLDSEGSRRAK